MNWVKRRRILPVWLLSLSGGFISSGTLHAACTPPPSGLVGWWTCDGTPNDIGGTNTASFGGGVVAANGYVAGALGFDGASGYVATLLDVQPGAMPSTTWEAWVYPTRLGGRQQILSGDDGGYDRSVMVEGNNFGVFTGSGVWSPTAVTPNQWQHIAVVFTSTNIEFYVNGVGFSYGAAPTFGGSTRRLNIGRNPAVLEYFQGLVDEVSVYNRALSQSEIAAIYAAGTDGKCKPALPSADLAVGVSALTNYITLAETATFYLNVSNLGPDLATNVFVTDSLPSNMGFLSALNPAGTYSQSGSLISFTVSNIPVNAGVTLQVTANALSAGITTNQAHALSGTSDSLLANNNASAIVTIDNAHSDADNGNWADRYVTLTYTSEAELMLRTGDIDNLNFGWPAGFNPFTGASTPPHSYPWQVDTNDPSGTDRIMVVSSYNGNPPHGQDGYTSTTTRPGNLPQSITISNQSTGLTVRAAVLQMFVDDFQAPVWWAVYQATINGVRAPFLEDVLNQLIQTGPIGRLITLQVPADYLSLVSTGNVTLFIDDPTTGAGDGFAVDFVKLLLNPRAFSQTGTLVGAVRDAIASAPITNAQVSAGGGLVTAYTDATGAYTLSNVTAGLVFVTASVGGFYDQTLSTNLVAGQTVTVNFQLSVVPRLRVAGVSNGNAVIRWPALLSNWILQTTPALPALPNAWSVVNNPRSTVGNEIEVLYPIGGTSAFFRLQSP
jgi:uncharacterized repeat protein (TIGR01451 family)